MEGIWRIRTKKELKELQNNPSLVADIEGEGWNNCSMQSEKREL
jgi:hypothetical protein